MFTVHQPAPAKPSQRKSAPRSTPKLLTCKTSAPTTSVPTTSFWAHPHGELANFQDDWYDGLDVVKNADLSGKTVAIFGCGDSASYGDTFCGAMKELYDAAKAAGANVIGAVSTEGYTFDDSDAVVDGQFVGLALDDINEDDKTDSRIDAWIAKLGL